MRRARLPELHVQAPPVIRRLGVGGVQISARMHFAGGHVRHLARTVSTRAGTREATFVAAATGIPNIASNAVARPGSFIVLSNR